MPSGLGKPVGMGKAGLEISKKKKSLERRGVMLGEDQLCQLHQHKVVGWLGRATVPRRTVELVAGGGHQSKRRGQAIYTHEAKPGERSFIKGSTLLQKGIWKDQGICVTT